MDKKGKGRGDVVPGAFGGKHTIEHLINHLREDANPEGPAIIMFENKKGDIVPVVLNISTEDLCFFNKIFDLRISEVMNGNDWEEKEK